MKLGNLFATCQKEPQLVLFDRPSQRAVEVIDLVDCRLARHTAGHQLLIDVGPYKAGAHPADEQISMKLVAAVLGNHVGVDAPAGNFRGDAAGLIGRFLNDRVIDIILGPAVGDGGVDEHAIQQVGAVVGQVAVRGDIGLLDLHGAGHIWRVQVNAGNIRTEGLHVSRARDRVHVRA